MRKTILLLLTVAACSPKEIKTTGSIERYDAQLDAILSPDAKVEIIGEGFTWSEGPVWIDQYQMLLFSDVPENVVYKWTEEKGVEEYLKPSGFTGTETQSTEPGANGLLLDDEGNLVLCQHGDRRVAMMDAEINEPQPVFTALADNYQGKKLNSPNDACFDMNYNLYFTDPPYGLPLRNEEDPTKEIPFQGVFRTSANGVTIALVDSLTRPNGVALSPDNKYLYVANSDPAKAKWYRYELGDSSVVSGSVFYDATSMAATEKGLPDGFKVDSNGNIFASGPGGVFIFNSEAKLLGKIKLDNACSNTALSGDEKTLYITNDMYVLRVKLRK